MGIVTEWVDVVVTEKYDVIEYEWVEEYEYDILPEPVDAGEIILVDPDAPCFEHYIRDCDNKCAPAFWIGNGVCNDGSETEGLMLGSLDGGSIEEWSSWTRSCWMVEQCLLQALGTA